MTLKEFLDCFQRDLNDAASILIAIEEATYIMKEEHNTEINIYIGMILMYEIITLSESIGSLKNHRLIHGPVPQIHENANFLCINMHVLTPLTGL